MNPVLTLSRRNGLVETVHRGCICIVDANGSLVLSLGDVEAKTYPRSAMKMVQVLPLLRAGLDETLGLSLRELAIMCGSHNAEAIHLDTVQAILRKGGVEAQHLACGAHEPLGYSARIALCRSGESPTALHNNCSGKHAGFLALARHLGAPLEGYLQPEHPVQVAVRAEVCDLFEVKENELIHGIDGCSAPNYGMALLNIAIGYKNLATRAAQGDRACQRMMAAVMSEPYMVAGEGRYCTDLMRQVPGRVLAKLGADGLYAMSIPGLEWGVAIKIDDGATGPQYNVAQALLEQIGVVEGLDAEALSHYKETPILNCMGAKTGSRVVADAVMVALSGLQRVT